MECLKETLVLCGQSRFRFHVQQFRNRDIQFLAEPGHIINVRAGQAQFPVSNSSFGISEFEGKFSLIHAGSSAILADNLTDVRTPFRIDDRAATSTASFLL